jgi:hypothetical protein
MNELPKALSLYVRNYLAASNEGHDALTWIDAATELLAEYAAQVFLDGQRIAELEERARDAEADVAYDAQAFGNAQRRFLRAEQKLAAANALLQRVQSRGPTRGDGALNGDIDAHLAGQPAAPRRTDAEQAVLDAMAKANIGEYVATDGARVLTYTNAHVEAACSAELARRGLQ